MLHWHTLMALLKILYRIIRILLVRMSIQRLPIKIYCLYSDFFRWNESNSVASVIWRKIIGMASKHYTAKWLNKLPIFPYVFGCLCSRITMAVLPYVLGCLCSKITMAYGYHNLVGSMLVTGNPKYYMVLLIHSLSYSVCRMFKDHELFANIKIVYFEDA